MSSKFVLAAESEDLYKSQILIQLQSIAIFFHSNYIFMTSACSVFGEC